MKIFICIPTYNEAENINLLLSKLEHNIKEIKNHNFAFVIIDDNSPDRTIEKIDIDKYSTPIHILHNPTKMGLSNAYIKAINFSIKQKADAICQIDADLSHPPEKLKEFVDTLQESDLVIGSRYLNASAIINWDKTRLLLSKLENATAKLFLRQNITDFTGGFNCYKTCVFDNIDIDTFISKSYGFQIELKYRIISAGFKYTEIPITFRERVLGKSKLDLITILELFYTPIKLVLRSIFNNKSKNKSNCLSC